MILATHLGFYKVSRIYHHIQKIYILQPARCSASFQPSTGTKIKRYITDTLIIFPFQFSTTICYYIYIYSWNYLLSYNNSYYIRKIRGQILTEINHSRFINTESRYRCKWQTPRYKITGETKENERITRATVNGFHGKLVKLSQCGFAVPVPTLIKQNESGTSQCPTLVSTYKIKYAINEN